jgi:hypothetical protein
LFHGISQIGEAGRIVLKPTDRRQTPQGTGVLWVVAQALTQ